MRLVKTKLLIFTALLLLLFEHTAFGAQGIIIQGGTTSAMGGAGRAGTEAGEVVFLNPASLAFLQGVNGGFLFKDGGLDGYARETSFAVSLLENNPDNVSPGGFAYAERRRRVEGLGAVTEKFILGAMGKFIAPRLALGASVYWAEQILDQQEAFRGFNGTLGLTYVISKNFGVSYVVSNLASPQERMPEAMRMVTHQAVGFHLQIPQMVRITLDAIRWEQQNPEMKGIIQGGVELHHGYFLTRMGFQVDDIRKQNFGTLGLSFNGPRLKVNYAFSKPLHSGAEGALHGVDLQVPF